MAEYRDFISTTGYGTGEGLCGYNCRHTFYPFWPGISKRLKHDPEPKPKEIDGKTYTYYEATQRQRSIERSVRALKREKNADNPVPQSAIDAEIRKYNEFSKKAGLKPHAELLRVIEK